MNVIILFISLLVSQISCGFSLESIIHNLINPDRYEVTPMPKDDSVVRILVFADFGDISNFFQIGKTSHVMNNLALKHKYQYMITSGDNFYPNGIKYTWLRVLPWIVLTQFQKRGLMNLKIYPTLGNHD